jgi:hypothetical protein
MVDVKTEQHEPYVIVVPKVETDSAAWARSVNAKLINSPNTDEGKS